MIKYSTDFPTPNVSISDEGFAISGYTDYILHCVATGEFGLSSLVTFTFQWFNPNGYEIAGSNITVTESASGNSVKSSLKFTNLQTSQAGKYL